MMPCEIPSGAALARHHPENPPDPGKFLSGPGLGMGLARLLMHHRDIDTVRRRLRAVGDAQAQALLGLLDRHEATARGILAILDSPLDRATGGTVEEEIGRCRALFDWAVQVSPEASVAFYSLGDPELLEQATQEVAHFMASLGLLGPAVDLLDLGCGIGRFTRALAPHVGSVLAIDVSPAMVREARQRCADLGNVRFSEANGRDLAPIGDRSLDLVLAADCLPYVFRAGGEPLLASMLAEIARVLRPGGQLLALNLTYRGDAAADRRFLQAHAGSLGLDILSDGAAPLASWDGLVFRLRRSL
jgi:SAM-dependent methyltransferase